jgi:hypothetical protein
MAPRSTAAALLLACALTAPLPAASSPLPSPPLRPARPAPGVAGLSHAELFPSDAHHRTRGAHRRVMAGWKPAAPVGAAAAPRALYPVSFGADPSCATDSSAAFDTLTAALVAGRVGNMSDGIADLGGAVVDLQGGCYLLSRPFAIPQFVGNMRVTYGELRAGPSFPPGGELVSVGASPCKTPSGQGSCNENVAFNGCVRGVCGVLAGAVWGGALAVCVCV